MDLLYDYNPDSEGTAFIKYEDPIDAHRAIAHFYGIKSKDQTLGMSLMLTACGAEPDSASHPYQYTHCKERSDDELVNEDVESLIVKPKMLSHLTDWTPAYLRKLTPWLAQTSALSSTGSVPSLMTDCGSISSAYRWESPDGYSTTHTTPIDLPNGTPSPTQSLSGIPWSTMGFKCDYPGCTALPFQTQYLLR